MEVPYISARAVTNKAPTPKKHAYTATGEPELSSTGVAPAIPEVVVPASLGPERKDEAVIDHKSEATSIPKPEAMSNPINSKTGAKTDPKPNPKTSSQADVTHDPPPKYTTILERSVVGVPLWLVILVVTIGVLGFMVLHRIRSSMQNNPQILPKLQVPHDSFSPSFARPSSTVRTTALAPGLAPESAPGLTPAVSTLGATRLDAS